MTDQRLRELERRWQESGTEEDAEAYLQEKVRVEGWPIRMILELALQHVVGLKPGAGDLLAWWQSDGLLPCVNVGCKGKLAMITNQYEGSGHDHPGSRRRICSDCYAGLAVADSESFGPWQALSHAEPEGPIDPTGPDDSSGPIVVPWPEEGPMAHPPIGDYPTLERIYDTVSCTCKSDPPGDCPIHGPLLQCANPDCFVLLLPEHTAIYCSNACALDDA